MSDSPSLSRELSGAPEPAPEIIMAGNGVYWRRYFKQCPACFNGRPRWAGTMPAPPCPTCRGTTIVESLSMVPTSDDNDPVLTPFAVYRIVAHEDHAGKRTPILDREDFEQLVTDVLVALDDFTDLPDGPSVDDAREAVMRELLSFERMRSAS